MRQFKIKPILALFKLVKLLYEASSCSSPFKENNMNHNQVKLHRVLAAPVEKVFRAFTQADAMASWLPPYGFVCTVHSMDVKVGGTYKMSFTNFTTGNSHSFGGEYIEVIPDEKLKYTDQFDDPNLPGQMITTVILKTVVCGTELVITQEGIPEAIPVEMCYLGWQESLDKLKKLVEPNIPDA
jgi:uncharacterized protein YndB with AHSA1/START domain